MKKLLIILLVLITACSNKNGTGDIEKKDENQLHDDIVINLNLLNEQTDDYYLFFVKPEVIKYDLKTPSFSDYYGPIEINGFQKKIKISEHVGLDILLEVLEEKKLQIAITTREDYLLRNPLNEETFIYFDSEEDFFNIFKATEKIYNIDITDKYPDGVNSLAFPTYPLAIKLIFDEGVEIVNSYSARIRQFDNKTPSGLGMYAPGSPLINKQNYYNAAFSGDHFKNYSGILEISTFDNRRVSYEGEPIKITFDEDGLPENSRMTIKILD